MVVSVVLVYLGVASQAGALAFLLPNRGVEARWRFHTGRITHPNVGNYASMASLVRNSHLFNFQRVVYAPGDCLSAAGGAVECDENVDNGVLGTHRRQLGTSRVLHVRLLASRMQQMVQFYCGLLGMVVLGSFKPGSSNLSPGTGEDRSGHSNIALWGPLNGSITLSNGETLRVDEVVLLGFPEYESTESGPCSSHESDRCLNTLKIELIYCASWAEQQIATEEAQREALKREERSIVSAISAFHQRHRLLTYNENASIFPSNKYGAAQDGSHDDGDAKGRLDGDGLPSLARVRAFEGKRGRFDRGHHGFFGFTVLLPSLEALKLDKVLECGAKMVHCPAKRKQVPSMFPDQHVGHAFHCWVH